MKTMHHSEKKTLLDTIHFAFICDDRFPPFRSDVKILFGQQLSQKEYSIDWILPSEKPAGAHTVSWEGGRAFVGPRPKGDSIIAKSLNHICRFAHYIKGGFLVARKDYDFIQVKDLFWSALPALLAAKILRKPFFFWLSYPFPEAQMQRYRDRSANYPLVNFFRGTTFSFLLYRIIVPLSDHVFVQSDQMKRDLQQKGVPVEKMTPVPMGVRDDSIMHELSPQEIKELNDAPVKEVLHLGTMIRLRRLDFLVRAFIPVLEKHPSSKLVFVGCGEAPEDEAFVIEEATRLGIEERVEITGFLPFDEAMQRVRKAHVCISPYYPTPVLYSTSPTKLLEYMAMSKPTVANSHPEQSAILAETGAGICVEWEEAAFAKAILQLLDDPEGAVEAGSRGREWVMDNRAYSMMANMLDRKYRSLLKQPR